MAWVNDAIKRRLEGSVKAPTLTPEQSEEQRYSITGSVGAPPVAPDRVAPTYTATGTQATYAPGGGSTPNYQSNQRYSNGVQASPSIGQADLPKYENVDQFDFNRNYEDTLDSLQRSRADLQQQRDLESQRLQEEYGRIFRDIRQQQQDALAVDAERMASRGILRSGLAVKSAGNIGNEFGGALDEQQRAMSAALEDQTSRYAQADRGIQENIGRAQEYLTRQQQMLEEQRARQAAAAAAAQRAAFDAGNVAEQQKPMLNVVKDNLGKYFVVDPNSMTRQAVDQNTLSALNQTHRVNTVDSLQGAAQLFGGDYATRANALARKLGGNLNNQASLDVRLGFRDIGAYR